jgi:D-beta-D-heptose 7-phosphate kinase/D-beta-D-heptose 1-phosphate adenosyltransferase
VKIKTRDQIKEICITLREQGLRIVFTNGCFDILHPGHIHCLKTARDAGDVLVLGMNDDESVKGLKGAGRPVLAQDQRAEILSALEIVDYVVLFHESTPYELVKAVQPDVLVKGGDYREEEVVGRDVVMARGGYVLIVPPLPGVSTTEIIRKIQSLGEGL